MSEALNKAAAALAARASAYPDMANLVAAVLAALPSEPAREPKPHREPTCPVESSGC